jgi:hypothetical protein
MTSDPAIPTARIAEYRRPRRRTFAERVSYPRAPLEIRDSRPGGIDWSQSAILGHRTAAARDFADLVATRMVNGTLPWTQRQLLLRHASRRQISRFEANLIIAAVANHFRPLGVSAACDSAPGPTRYSFILRGLAAFLAVEIIALTIAWHFLF